jgi:hypothetical protein
MRYRHNITIDKSFTNNEWSLIEIAFKRLINNLPDYSLSGGDEYKNESIELSDVLIGETSTGCRRIIFNGKDKINGNEIIRRSAHAFCLTQKLMNNEDFVDRIDTEAFPYDLVVCALLIFLKIEFPKNVFIHTDGNDAGWTHSVNIASRLFYNNQYISYKITDEIAQLNWLNLNLDHSFKRFQEILTLENKPGNYNSISNIYVKDYIEINWFY